MSFAVLYGSSVKSNGLEVSCFIRLKMFSKSALRYIVKRLLRIDLFSSLRIIPPPVEIIAFSTLINSFNLRVSKFLKNNSPSSEKISLISFD